MTNNFINKTVIVKNYGRLIWLVQRSRDSQQRHTKGHNRSPPRPNVRQKPTQRYDGRRLQAL